MPFLFPKYAKIAILGQECAVSRHRDEAWNGNEETTLTEKTRKVGREKREVKSEKKEVGRDGKVEPISQIPGSAPVHMY